MIQIMVRNVAALYSFAMRYPPSRAPSQDLRPRHSLHTTIVGTVVAALLVPVLVMAVIYPVMAASVGVLALVTELGVRTLRKRSQARLRQGRTRYLCIPKTRVCVKL